MANHRVGETGLSDSGPSSQPVAYGVHGITPAATNFFDQEGAAYFGELEEALMQGVAGMRNDGDRKPFFTTRPPTLEIFPSWPMRFQQTPKCQQGNSQPAESTDSGSAQNTISQPDSESPGSVKASSEQSSEQQQQRMMAGDAPSAEAAAPNHQPKTQDNEKYMVNVDLRERHNNFLLGRDVQSPQTSRN